MGDVRLNATMLSIETISLGTLATTIQGAADTCKSSLSGTTFMAGDDEAGEVFASGDGGENLGYDTYASQTLDAVYGASDLVRLLEAALTNTARAYDNAQLAAEGKGRTSSITEATPTLLRTTGTAVPTAYGEGPQEGLGEFADLVLDKLREWGVTLPCADTGKLGTAKGAWTDLSSAMTSASTSISGDLTVVDSSEFPEKSSITACRTSMTTYFSQVGSSAGGMAELCQGMITNVDAAWHEIRMFLTQMAIEIVAEIGLGIVLGAISFGAGAVAMTAKVLVTVGKWVLKIVDKCKELARLMRAIGRMAAALGRRMSRLLASAVNEGMAAAGASAYSTALINDIRLNSDNPHDANYEAQSVWNAAVSAGAGGAGGSVFGRGVTTALNRTGLPSGATTSFVGDVAGGGFDGFVSNVTGVQMGEQGNMEGAVALGAIFGGTFNLGGRGVNAVMNPGGAGTSAPTPLAVDTTIAAATGNTSTTPSNSSAAATTISNDAVPTPGGGGGGGSASNGGGGGIDVSDNTPTPGGGDATPAVVDGGGVEISDDAPSASDVDLSDVGGSSADGGAPEIDAPDVSAPDVSAPDVSAPDVSAPDVGGPDGAAPDLSVPDAGPPDLGVPDAGSPDAGTPDLGVPDAGTPDLGVPDAGTPDAGTPDPGAPDAGTPDAGTPDLGAPETGTPEGGTPETGATDSNATPAAAAGGTGAGTSTSATQPDGADGTTPESGRPEQDGEGDADGEAEGDGDGQGEADGEGDADPADGIEGDITPEHAAAAAAGLAVAAPLMNGPLMNGPAPTGATPGQPGGPPAGPPPAKLPVDPATNVTTQQHVDAIVDTVAAGTFNPTFDGDPHAPASNNCGSTASRANDALRGGPVRSADHSTRDVAGMEGDTGVPQVVMTPDQIVSTLQHLGPGSHTVVGIVRNSGPGHWFTAINDGGTIRTVDPQTGQIGGWPPAMGDVSFGHAGFHPSVVEAAIGRTPDLSPWSSFQNGVETTTGTAQPVTTRPQQQTNWNPPFSQAGSPTATAPAPLGTTPNGTVPGPLGASPDGAPPGTSPDGTAPDASPDGTAPGTSPEGASPDRSSPDGTWPDGTSPSSDAPTQDGARPADASQPEYGADGSRSPLTRDEWAITELAGRMQEHVNTNEFADGWLTDADQATLDRAVELGILDGPRMDGTYTIPMGELSTETPGNCDRTEMQHQFDDAGGVLRETPISDWLLRRADFINHPERYRESSGSADAQTAARKDWITDYAESLQRQDPTLSDRAANDLAAQELKRLGLQATHALDMVAGGNPTDISGMNGGPENGQIGNIFKNDFVPRIEESVIRALDGLPPSVWDSIHLDLRLVADPPASAPSAPSTPAASSTLAAPSAPAAPSTPTAPSTPAALNPPPFAGAPIGDAPSQSAAPAPAATAPSGPAAHPPALGTPPATDGPGIGSNTAAPTAPPVSGHPEPVASGSTEPAMAGTADGADPADGRGSEVALDVEDPPVVDAPAAPDATASDAAGSAAVEAPSDGAGVDPDARHSDAEVTAPSESYRTEHPSDRVSIEGDRVLLDGTVIMSREEFAAILDSSFHNAAATEAVLGKFHVPGTMSYVDAAEGRSAMYFSLGERWGEISSRYGLEDADMFELFNVPFLDFNIAHGHPVVFSHNPLDYPGSALGSELRYLERAGYVFDESELRAEP